MMYIRHTPTLFLKFVLLIITLAVLALCGIVLPLGITSDNVGYYRPILIGMYIPALPFFYGLYQALRLLHLIDKDKIFSLNAVEALKKIKYSAFVISGLYALGMPYIYYAAERDDAPGVVLIGLAIVFVSFVVGTFAGVMQRLFQNAVEIQLENDLTV